MFSPASISRRLKGKKGSNIIFRQLVCLTTSDKFWWLCYVSSDFGLWDNPQKLHGMKRLPRTHHLHSLIKTSRRTKKGDRLTGQESWKLAVRKMYQEVAIQFWMILDPPHLLQIIVPHFSAEVLGQTKPRKNHLCKKLKIQSLGHFMWEKQYANMIQTHKVSTVFILARTQSPVDFRVLLWLLLLHAISLWFLGGA